MILVPPESTERRVVFWMWAPLLKKLILYGLLELPLSTHSLMLPDNLQLVVVGVAPASTVSAHYGEPALVLPLLNAGDDSTTGGPTYPNLDGFSTA